MTGKEFEAFVCDIYGDVADRPFERYPDVVAFRHKGNRKWFAVMMRVSKRKLGFDDDTQINIVNVKCAQEIMPSLWQEDGIFPAYHMSKAHWLTLCLDGSVDNDTLAWLLEISYDLTKTKISRKKERG